ncbi:hypothetical protein [Streptomyces sp. NPDC059176]|uniref:hypothetical protein n=1 Tax=unclassified Streptomyces TaxID=2593676 RepID=UPI0036B9C36A
MKSLPRRPAAVLTVAMLAALLLGGCADGSGGSAGNAPASGNSGAPGNPSPAAPEEAGGDEGSPAAEDGGAPQSADPEELARMQRLLDEAESAADDADADSESAD